VISLKDLIKSLRIFIVALFVAIIVYPSLHELGHLMVAILVGTRVVEMQMFPIPNILCENVSISCFDNILIGFGGISLPAIVSISISSNKFWMWYANFILKVICLLSFVISGLAIIFEGSQLFAQDDMRAVLNIWDSGKSFCIAILFVMVIIFGCSLYNEHLWMHCKDYFKLSVTT